MIEFHSIHLSILLLLIPILIIAFIAHNYLKKRQLNKFGDTTLMQSLMPLTSKTRGWFKIIILCVAIFFFVVALIRPRIGAVIKEIQSQGVEVMIALDVSNSMLATDFAPSRLENAKMAISRLVDKMRGDKVGLIVFAGEAYVQVPITSDYTSTKLFLNSINPGMVSRQGTDIDKAIALSMKTFSTQSLNSRALIIITDGESHEGNAVDMAKIAYKDGITIHTVGIGSPNGSPIKLPGGEMLRDKDGEIVVTRLDESTLKQIAGAGGGTYTQASQSDLGLSAVINHIKTMDKQELHSEQFKDYHELYRYPLAIALVLLILEGLIFNRKNKVFAKINVFGKH